MMEAACTSETSVDIQTRTRQYIPEDSELHTCHRENFKSHMIQCRLIKIQLELLSNSTEYKHYELPCTFLALRYFNFQDVKGCQLLDVQMTSSRAGGREEIKCTRDNRTPVNWLLHPSRSV
jgi:hypothetical protein